MAWDRGLQADSGAVGVSSAQRRTVRRSQRRAGLEGVRLEFFEVRQQFLFVGPTLQIEADHFVGS